MDISLTDNEIKILVAARDNDFDNAFEDGCPWVFTIIDEVDKVMTRQQAGGVISSLIKKGVCIVDDYDGDEIFLLTDQGMQLSDFINEQVPV